MGGPIGYAPDLLPALHQKRRIGSLFSRAFPQRRFQRPPGIVYDAAVFTELASFFFFRLRVSQMEIS
jgi:hypothetical protein